MAPLRPRDGEDHLPKSVIALRFAVQWACDRIGLDRPASRCELGAWANRTGGPHPSKAAFPLAGFWVITYGRIEVSTEVRFGGKTVPIHHNVPTRHYRAS